MAKILPSSGFMLWRYASAAMHALRSVDLCPCTFVLRVGQSKRETENPLSWQEPLGDC